ncbi:hypothetical protein HDV03_001198 [Kappamyces sp. JEL0829]|nr:hypothetical protein HDV03_001198 [Kappamyces sp. JEL0829]
MYRESDLSRVKDANGTAHTDPKYVPQLHNPAYYDHTAVAALPAHIHPPQTLSSTISTNSLHQGGSVSDLVSLPDAYAIKGPDELQLPPLKVEPLAPSQSIHNPEASTASSALPQDILDNFGSLPPPDEALVKSEAVSTEASMQVDHPSPADSNDANHTNPSSTSSVAGDKPAGLKIKLKMKAPVLVAPKLSWQLVCKSRQDWLNFPLIFKDSAHPDEMAFYRYLTDLVPLVIRDIDASEAESQRREKEDRELKRKEMLETREREEEEKKELEKALAEGRSVQVIPLSEEFEMIEKEAVAGKRASRKPLGSISGRKSVEFDEGEGDELDEKPKKKKARGPKAK